MSLTHYIWVQDKSADFLLDAAAANAALQAGSMREYFEDRGEGPGTRFIDIATANSPHGAFSKGDVVFYNEYENGRDASCSVETWGLFSEQAAGEIAQHVKTGYLVLRVDIEGNQPEFYMIKPGVGGLVQPVFAL